MLRLAADRRMYLPMIAFVGMAQDRVKYLIPVFIVLSIIQTQLWMTGESLIASGGSR